MGVPGSLGKLGLAQLLDGKVANTISGQIYHVVQIDTGTNDRDSECAHEL